MSEKYHPFEDLLPGYALQALDLDEVRLVEKHLRTCADCRASLEEYQTVSGGLLFALPAKSPPPRVRARLIASLAAQKPQTSVRQGARPIWQWAMGIASALLLVLNLSTWAQLYSMQRQQAMLASQLRTSQTALALVAYPEGQTFGVSGKGTGTLVLNFELRSGVLFAWGLNPLDSAHTYQIWLIQKDGKRVSGGLFRPDPEQPFVSALISSPQPLSDFVGLGVTVEPSGGSLAPTGQRVLEASF